MYSLQTTCSCHVSWPIKTDWAFLGRGALKRQAPFLKKKKLYTCKYFLDDIQNKNKKWKMSRRRGLKVSRRFTDDWWPAALLLLILHLYSKLINYLHLQDFVQSNIQTLGEVKRSESNQTTNTTCNSRPFSTSWAAAASQVKMKRCFSSWFSLRVEPHIIFFRGDSLIHPQQLPDSEIDQKIKTGEKRASSQQLHSTAASLHSSFAPQQLHFTAASLHVILTALSIFPSQHFGVLFP